jgi:hypothetical protein
VSEPVHRSDQSEAVGDVELLLLGLSVLRQRHRTAPAGTASPLDSHRIERQILVPGVTVSGLRTAGRIAVFIPALLEANGMTGRLASLSTKILDPLSHTVLYDVADVGSVLAVHEQ